MIKIAHMVLSCACMMFLTSAVAEAKKWRGITPLHSTREDVERLLGPPAVGRLTEQCRCLYDTGDETVYVIYANGLPCNKPEERDWRVGGWKVPRDTVIEITVYSKKNQNLPDLKIDESKYKKIANEELPGVFYYINVEEGIKIEVDGDAIGGVTYFHTSTDAHLSCQDNHQDQPSSSGGLSAKEKESLDRFMLWLTPKPDISGWIQVDLGPQGASESTLTDRIIKYLKDKYSKDFGRITITEGKHPTEGIKLFIVPRDGKPIPFSEIESSQSPSNGKP